MRSIISVLLIFVSMIFSLLFFTACTDYRDSKKAIAQASHDIEKNYRQEIDLKVDNKEDFKTTYISSLMDQTEIEVLELKQVGGKRAAVVKVSKVPQKVRLPLIDIIAKIENWKEAKFNSTEAIALINKQLGISPSEKEVTTYDVLIDPSK